MIPEIKKILYATDLSPNSAYVFRYAINSAKKHDADIIILHVIDKLPPMARALVEVQLGQSRREEIQKSTITHAIERIRDRLQALPESATGHER